MAEGTQLLEAPTQGAMYFNLTTPLLSEGLLTKFVAAAGKMDVAMKSYARGGENTLHAHTKQDHLFVVLQGRARFCDQDGNERELGLHEGILMAKGWFYKFESSGNEPLVMLRVASGEYDSLDERKNDRIGVDGNLLESTSEENNYTDPVYIPGAFFK
jgi:mannose-6-phosphate isomerase-like protein (cupin superfamily)